MTNRPHHDLPDRWIEPPDREKTTKLDDAAEEILEGVDNRQRCLLFNLMAVKCYRAIDDPAVDLMDYQIAAEQIANDVGHD